MNQPGGDGAEKTEDATPYKLREARKQGNVFKSVEVNNAVAIVIALLLLVSIGKEFIGRVLMLCKSIFRKAGEVNYAQQDISFLLRDWTSELGREMAPIVLGLLLAGILGSLIQVGLIFSAKPLVPQFSRLNPITGFKNKFSKRLLWDSLKTILKFVVFSLISLQWLIEYWPKALQYTQMAPVAIFKDFLGQSVSLISRLAIALVLMALIDFIHSRKEYLQKMRMSKQEVKDELKRRDGDPHIRSRRRELEAELRKRSASLANVPGADVVITNPTHFAVVLKYDQLKMNAPAIVGMGAGEMARAIRERASECGVPIVHMPPLARHLFKKGKMEQPVPQDCFLSVARALGRAYAIKRKMKDESVS